MARTKRKSSLRGEVKSKKNMKGGATIEPNLNQLTSKPKLGEVYKGLATSPDTMGFKPWEQFNLTLQHLNFLIIEIII